MLDQPRNISRPTAAPVRLQERLLDALALLLLAAGVLVFAVGRSSLRALAAESYRPPPSGVTWVSRAELHDAQTRWGMLIAGAGVVLSVGAALRHTIVRRRSS
jgi:hypothetical protein